MITCKPTGKQYVGSASRSFAGRFRQHRYRLRRGDHHSPQLQAAWNKHGEGAFEFTVLLRCPPEQVLLHEQRLIDTMRPVYNTIQVAGSSSGFRFSPEQRIRLADRPQSQAKTYEYAGEQLTVPEIARRLGITPAGLYFRLRMGRGVLPRVTRTYDQPIPVGTEQLTPRQIAEKFDLPLTTVYSRLGRGWSGAALTAPRKHRARNSH